VLGKFPERLHHSLTGPAHSGFRDHPGVIKRQGFAIIHIQAGLVVKTIDLTDSTLHEKENDPFGFGSVVGNLWREGIGRLDRFAFGVGLPGGHGGKRE
jgi:hypothetical protein